MSAVRTTADLREYLQAVDWCYFHGHLDDLDVQIKWMRTAALDRRIGCYDADLRTIEINRRLAYDFAPRFFVLQVIFHEGLHALHGPEHNHAFHAAEKQFALTYESLMWEREHFDTLCAMPVPKGLR
jgi:hypothetical protein